MGILHLSVYSSEFRLQAVLRGMLTARLPRDPDAKGTGEVMTECPHCDCKVMVTVPRKHIEKGPTIIREEDKHGKF